MKNINLLIIDEQKENLVSLQALLSKIEHVTIICATDPKEAGKICQKKDIAIILIALQTSKTNAFEPASLLKSDTGNNPIIVATVTSSSKDEKLLVHALQNGATDYLDTSLHPDIIIAKVRSLIRQIHLQQEVADKKHELELSKKTWVQTHQETNEAQKSKEIFLANMSHEIRTPINGIVGIVHMFKNAKLSPEHRDWVYRLEMASDYLLLIINDILDISKIESGRLNIEFEEFNLINLLSDIERFFRFKALDKQIDFKVDIDPSLPKHVRFDSPRLQQILSNFISNSLKFTDEGEIALSVTILERKDRQVKIRFTVKDSGIGIKPEALEKIFQAFKQGDDRITKKIGGLGLGLAIVKKLANLLDGTVHAESEFGHGSRFSFTVEMEEALEAENIKIPENLPYDRLPKLKGLKVLIAEDNDLNSFMLSYILQTWLCEVTIVKNGRLVLEAFEASDYDVVLMDTHMPVMSGFEAIRQIRTHYREHLRTVPIITISASVLEHEQKAAFEVGADEVIGKPFNPIELYNKIVRVCNLAP